MHIDTQRLAKYHARHKVYVSQCKQFNWWNWLLMVEFIAACLMVAYVTIDMIAYSN